MESPKPVLRDEFADFTDVLDLLLSVSHQEVATEPKQKESFPPADDGRE